MTEISTKASFETIRYAQLWEDADILCEALGHNPGARLVSICSAGDNALAMLTTDPESVLAVDLSFAQIRCLELRIAAYRALDHQELLELMGSRPSDQRGTLLDRVIKELHAGETKAFWRSRRDEVIAYGAGGIGKFERYFRLFRTWMLPLVHRRATVEAMFQPRTSADRQHFLDETWNNRRWGWLLKLFFSRYAMGRLGRDPAFFDHVEGSVSDHVARKIVHAFVDQDPTENPYLHWIMKGTHGMALPLSLRPEFFDVIRSRLDRVSVVHGSLEDATAGAVRYDGWNLSDIFEYMAPGSFEQAYGRILKASAPQARLVYWNMMAPRRVPAAYRGSVERLKSVEDELKTRDKAFFYSDFVVERVL